MRSLHMVCALRFGVAALALLAVALRAQPFSLSANRATTTTGSTATTVWANVTDGGVDSFKVDATIPGSLGTGNVLVVASFSANSATAVTDTGQWRLSDGTTTSTEIRRTLSSNTNDQGIATVTWLFTGVAGTKTYHLQHKTLLGNGVRTHNATLVALPLAVGDGVTDLALAGAADNTGAYEYASASATGETVEKAAGVDLSAAIALPRPGRIFVAAALNCRPAAGAALHVAQWELQVDGVTISTTRRTMQAAGGNDRGAVTLYGLAEGLGTGTHNATILVKSISGQTIVTFNAVVAGVALSFDNDGVASSYYQLPAWVATGTNSLVAPGVGNTVTKSGLGYAAGTNVFLASSYYSQTTVTNTAQTGSFRLYASVGSTAYTSQTESRSLSGGSDIGSGGSVGLAASLNADTYSFSLEASNVQTGGGGAPTMQTNAVLVGFGLTSEAVAANGSIGGQVYNTVGPTGIDNVTLDLYLDANNDGLVDGGDTLLDTETTAGGGLYTFSALAAGDYLVTVTDTNSVLTGYALTVGTVPHDVALASAQVYTTGHFGYTLTSISVDKTASVALATIGQSLTYTVTATNTGIPTVYDITVTDPLPANVVYVSAGAGTGNQGGVPVVVYGAGTVTLTFPTALNAAEKAVAEISVYLDNSSLNHAGGLVENTASVGYATSGGGAQLPAGSHSATVTVTEPGLSVSKSVENVTSCSPPIQGKLPRHAPEFGDTLRYTVTITNGTTNSSTGYDLAIHDTLPVGLSYVASSTILTTASATFLALTEPDVSGQTLTWGRTQTSPQDRDLGVGETVVFTYDVTVTTATAGLVLENLLTVDWTSLNGVVANERDGVSGDPPNDYLASAEARITTWAEPTDVSVTGVGTVAADGTVTGAVSASLDGSRELILANGADLTVAGDGIPATPFGTPSVAVAASASALITTDGTASFLIDRLILNAGSTLRMAGDASYLVGSLTMAAGSALVLPDGASLHIAGSASITGASGYASLATIRPTTTYGGLTVVFECSASITYAHFAGIDNGYVQFLGPTALNHGLFSEGDGTNPYIKYGYAAIANWTSLAFRKEDGATTTIQNLQTAANTYVAVAGYLGPTDLNYLGGEDTDIEPSDVDAVQWSGATPAFGIETTCSAPETGGVLIEWSAQVELGVLKYLVQVAEGATWTTVGDMFACTEGLSGGSYEFLDRLAQPDKVRTYRLLCVDVDGRSREHAVGTVAAVAVAIAPALASVRVGPPAFPADGLATVEVLTYSVQRHATQTPAILGTARKATVAAGGLYGLGGVTQVYNLGCPLPDLGGMVYVRPYTDPYTDANVVWGSDDALARIGEPGIPPAPPAQGLLGPDGYIAVVHMEKDEALALNSMLPPGPNWFYSHSSRLAPDSNPIITASVPSPAANGAATVRVAVRSTTAGAHDLGVTVNGIAVARAAWTGQGHHLVQVTFDLATCPLLDGENQIQLWTMAEGSSKRLDYVEVVTPATPVLRDGSLVVDVLADGTGGLDVPGVLHAVDITEFGRESLLATSRGTIGGLHAGQKLYLTAAVGTLEWSEPKDLSAIDTALTGQQYVAVAPAAWLDVLPPLIAKHQAEGLASLAVSWEDVCDTYGGGLPTPAALVRLGRRIRPQYLLIAAGASHDPKGLSVDTVLPPAGIATGFVHVYEGTASTDDLYSGDFAIAVGRLPARNRAELLNMVNKIVDFYPGRRAVMMADVDDATMGFGDFARLQADLAKSLPSLLLDANTMGGTAMRAALIAAINDGANLVTYQGHGNNALIGDEFDIFNTSHVEQVPPSAWLLATCLTGVYTLEDAQTKVLASSLLRTPGNGAVSVLASTCYGQAGSEHLIAEAAVRRIAAGDATWGEILLNIKQTLLPDETAAIYTLLGDPATHTLNPVEGDREILIREPLAGGYVNGDQAPVIRFGLRGGWWRQRLEVSWRREYGLWMPLREVTIDPEVFEYTVPWDPPPEDGTNYQIMVREISTDREGR